MPGKAWTTCVDILWGRSMAKIEREFLQGRADSDDHQYTTPPFLPRKPIPDLGLERIDGERFYSLDFMHREWTHLWRRVWNVGVHVGDLPGPGSFRTHDLGKESLLFVRGEDDVIRAFFNVCQHRGNQLCRVEEGDARMFKCPYHGWEWNTDGSLRRVMDPQFFKQFDDGVPEGEFDLVEVRTAQWGGWVWFNIDGEAPELVDFLGEAGRHLEPYQLERYQLVDYKTFEWAGNWKHAHDAFNESYHFEALHPEFLNLTEGHDIPIELLGLHSRMLNFNHTVSEVVEDQAAANPLRHKMLEMAGFSPKEYQGDLKDAHLKLLAQKRAIEDDTYLPYRQLNDEQLVHQYHYTFFPGATFTVTPEACIVFRWRPHPTDPNYCRYDFLIMRHNPPGTPTPEYEHRLFRHDELPDYGAAFEGTFDPLLANVLLQDGSNMQTMQQGVQSEAFKGMVLCEQEIRIRHFHQNIDRFLSGTPVSTLMGDA